MAEITRKEIEIAGRTLSLEVGRVAGRANAAVLAQYGETVVLAVVTEDVPKEVVNYFPLRVDFVERLYAGGIIKGSRWVKREGKPSDDSVLAGRLVDRSVRPLFPKEYFQDVQVVTQPLSVDHETDPEVLSVVGAAAALAISDIPWNGPIGAVRVGYLPETEEFILNPTREQRAKSALDLVVSGTRERTVMIEAGGQEVSDEKMVAAIAFGQEKLQATIDLISELQAAVGRAKQPIIAEDEAASVVDAKKRIIEYVEENFVPEVLASGVLDADEQSARREKLYAEFEGKVTKAVMDELLEGTIKKAVRKSILEREHRLDGRDLKEIRPLSMEVGLLPRTHGSGLFNRGQTQVLTVATLGSTSLEQLIEGLTGEYSKRYIHHYNFPPFSTGEVSGLKAPGRREIGHGALAEKALVPVIPSEAEFPYTVLLVSEVLSSAGSTSMAATCGSTLALMDAGIPIKAPVAGIAIGLVEGADGQYKVLTDIEALEDFYGDMDFKIAGSEKGITAIQLDVKNTGLTPEMVAEAVERARTARLAILEEIKKVISAPREKLSEYAPKITRLMIDPKKIGLVIGPGGKTIRAIIEETGVAIDVEDDGTVLISSPDIAASAKAQAWVEGLVAEVEIGKVYPGKVTRVVDFGCFVEVLPGKEGLVHVSELAHEYVDDPHAVVKEGDVFDVKVLEIDSMGRVNLSKKALEECPPGVESQSREKRPSRSSDRRSGPGYRTPYHQRPSYGRH